MERYDLIVNELQSRVNSGEITLEFAEAVNDLAYDKYVMESEELSDDEKDFLLGFVSIFGGIFVIIFLKIIRTGYEIKRDSKKIEKEIAKTERMMSYSKKLSSFTDRCDELMELSNEKLNECKLAEKEANKLLQTKSSKEINKKYFNKVKSEAINALNEWKSFSIKLKTYVDETPDKIIKDCVNPEVLTSQLKELSKICDENIKLIDSELDKLNK